MSINPSLYRTYGTFGDVEKCFTHIVKKGETLVSLSVRFGIDTRMIIDRNRDHLDATRLREGDIILIPRGITEESEARKEEEEQEEEEKRPTPKTRKVHTVQEGESLDSIASSYDTTPSDVRRLNRNIFPVGERVTLRPGMQLVVITR